jgi:hypothetical protein
LDRAADANFLGSKAVFGEKMSQAVAEYQDDSTAFEQWAKTVVECLQVLQNLDEIG